MKMVKSLLLGTAAGIMAVAGAQAADLPVKAKPVEYVKVCSLYGAGFYYMPGTDICLKIGGYVRAQYYSWGGSSGTLGAMTHGGSTSNRSGANQDFTMRVRTIVSADTRQQTEYGTLRTYMNIGWTHDTGALPATVFNGTYFNRAFIQLAGFTFGKAQSFFDNFSPAAVSYFAWPSHDTGDGGVNLAAYTAQFGNGFSGSIAIEDAQMHRSSLINESGVPTYTVGSNAYGAISSYGNYNMPDIVANLRVDQAWGMAQVNAAVHQVRAGYYGLLESSGAPEDKYGWVVGAGVQLNTSFISPGDKFQLTATYTEGALRYLAATNFNTGSYGAFSGAQAGIGWVSDGVYGAAPGSIELTKGWSITGSYDHVWSQKWKTSLYGGYLDVSYGDTANALICGSFTFAAGSPACNNDWSTWWVGSRTQFNINTSTYLGVDVLYTKLNTMTEGGVITGGLVVPASKALPVTLADQDNLAVTFRIHRDFLP